MAAAQTVAVVEAGGRTVSLGDLLGPRFSAEPHVMFSWDRFHPSAAGYAAAASALLPTALAALGERQPQLAADEGVRTLPRAAHEAVRQAGTEVTGARVAGSERGPAGRWAQLRHRRAWFGQPRAEEPEAVPPAANGAAGPAPIPPTAQGGADATAGDGPAPAVPLTRRPRSGANPSPLEQS